MLSDRSVPARHYWHERAFFQPVIVLVAELSQRAGSVADWMSEIVHQKATNPGTAGGRGFSFEGRVMFLTAVCKAAARTE